MDNGNERTKEKKRRPGWIKAVDLILRGCHIGTASILFGGIVWAIPFARLYPWHQLTIATGSALIIFGICQCRHWPYQGRGIVATAHVVLLWLVHARPELMVPVLVTVLLLGVVGSNMPGFLRHWSVVHGRRID